jgi:hypothetical protein
MRPKPLKQKPIRKEIVRLLHEVARVRDEKWERSGADNRSVSEWLLIMESKLLEAKQIILSNTSGEENLVVLWAILAAVAAGTACLEKRSSF